MKIGATSPQNRYFLQKIFKKYTFFNKLGIELFSARIYNVYILKKIPH